MNLKKSICMIIVASMLMSSLGISANASNIGVNIHDNHTGYEFYTEDLGVEWVRWDAANWEEIQAGPGEAYIIPEDAIREVTCLAESGKKVMLIMAYGHSGYAASAGNDRVMPDGTSKDADMQEYYEGWLGYVEAVTKAFKGIVGSYEIWNEPDNPMFNAAIKNEDNGMPVESTYKQAGLVYGQLLKDTYTTIENIDPNAVVLGGSLANLAITMFTPGVGNKKIKTGTYAFAVSYMSVAKDYQDGVAIHMYDSDAFSPLAGSSMLQYEGTAEWIDESGYNGEIWMCESGMSTAWGNFVDGTNVLGHSSEDCQAAFTIHSKVMFDAWIKNNATKGQYIYYDLKNDGVNRTNQEANFGLISYFDKQRKSYYAVKTYNECVKGMQLYSFNQTADGTSGDYKNIATYKYADNSKIDVTYVVFNHEQLLESTGTSTISVTVPANTTYTVYNYAGEIQQGPTSVANDTLITRTVGILPEYVVCRRTVADTYISRIEFHPSTAVMSVWGSDEAAESVTVTITLNGNVMGTSVAPVVNGEFLAEISLPEYGENLNYVITSVGTGSATVTETVTRNVDPEESIVITIVGDDKRYNTNNLSVTLTGNLSAKIEGNTATIVVVPEGRSLSIDNAVYVGETDIAERSFEHTFTLPDNANGKYDVYFGCRRMAEIDNATIAQDFVVLCMGAVEVIEENGTYTLPDAAVAYVTDVDNMLYVADETMVVKADTTFYGFSEDGLSMVNGAQVRIGDGVNEKGKVDSGSGLRFITTVDRNETLAGLQEDYPTLVEYGVKITAQDSTGEVYIPATKFQSDEVFTTALTNLAETNYNRAFTAVPYVKITSSAGKTVEVTGTDKVVRSIYQVAAGLLSKGYTDEDNATGSDDSDTDYTEMSDILVKVLNAYVNQTGIRLAIVDGQLTAHDSLSESTKGGKYSAEAFFEVSGASCTGTVYRVTLTPNGNAEINMDYWNEYVRINNNNSQVKVVTTLTDNGDGTYTLTFDTSKLGS